MPVQSSWIWILLVFSIWMLSDAIRQRAGWFWYLVILLAPLGAVIYFVAIKLPSMSSRSKAMTEVGPLSGTAVTRKVASAFLSTNLDHADQLEENELYDEAMPIFREALERDANDLRALHGMARCELGLGHPRAAVVLLEQVLNSDREYRNFGAALDYADALWLAGQKKDTLELLRGLVAMTDRINHRLALAHYLAEDGNVAEAQAEIQHAIREHEAMPPDEQVKQQRWLERAMHMLAQWQ